MKVLFLILVVVWVLAVARLAYLVVRQKKQRQRKFEQELSEFTAGFDALAGLRRRLDDVEAARRVAAAKFGSGALRDGAEL